ncbi:hypothetical protein [Actinoplanes sp. NPDC026670]|uniref:hypothetical protein n=1 Tax=Actinoplanes sp. NPDC026670 TaxID=3154700 RepID=UPI0033D091E4
MTTTRPDPHEPVIPVRDPRSRRTVLTVGPRHLPADGWASVWLDTGSGPGYVRRVRSDRLTLADADDGDGDSAIYHLHPASEDIHGSL